MDRTRGQWEKKEENSAAVPCSVWERLHPALSVSVLLSVWSQVLPPGFGVIYIPTGGCPQGSGCSPNLGIIREHSFLQKISSVYFLPFLHTPSSTPSGSLLPLCKVLFLFTSQGAGLKEDNIVKYVDSYCFKQSCNCLSLGDYPSLSSLTCPSNSLGNYLSGTYSKPRTGEVL